MGNSMYRTVLSFSIFTCEREKERGRGMGGWWWGGGT